ncbi:uncharacterized protein A1O5_00113 [Cladophialophora psammophila CBS 110553]|uniref:Uncharacterized protein n=1 Tax=Cladophialophora psammophila CBS 110553 TaxID=1182543 RepID=W9XF69_9EURO|nr:uncharacterized protein A1O5_00113 [Cladophialophora psammophila CBS 110553]EXJ75606.1 hypothetical protein A1O5_00113 [Cladophialophora psammophila CBS 110553]
MEPYPSTLTSVDVPLLLNLATNQIGQGNRGRQLRYFRWTAHYVSGMLMELWLRFDPHVDMIDIMARIYLPSGMRMPQANTINMRQLRLRECVPATPFNFGRQYPTAMEVDQISKRTRERMLFNRCMTVDFPNNRLLKPVLASDKSAIGHIDSGLPLEYFLS